MGEAKEVRDTEAVIVIPRWLVSGTFTLLILAIPWAIKVNTDMATIATKLDAALIQQAKDTGWLKERVERNEMQLDEHERQSRRVLDDFGRRLNEIEGKNK